jgi:phosphomannomutase
MAIIKSISGIRGTMGDKIGEGLDPILVVKYCLAFATWLKRNRESNQINVIVGRDGRISGEVLEDLVVSTLLSAGINVVKNGYSTTPTIEMAVILSKADGGIILTASHNPANWNALKFFNEKGEFISPETGQKLLEMVESEDFELAKESEFGIKVSDAGFMQKHVDAVVAMPIVNRNAIAAANFMIVADVINSTGSHILPLLFDALGVRYKILNGECNGKFAHNPEPLPSHLTELSKAVVDFKADMGVSVDPDVDRLALVCEDGQMFGEEYTLVAAADYVLSHKTGNTVSNLSSTQALRDITDKYGGKYFAAAVGEVNVVNKMKETNAIIGGEGNGGVIYPDLHYGRDALVGIALILSLMAERKNTLTQLKTSYPAYYMSKKRVDLTVHTNIDEILSNIESQMKSACKEINKTDGLKLDFGNEWVHLRKSNTEPIIRIYTESPTQSEADLLADKFITLIKQCS